MRARSKALSVLLRMALALSIGVVLLELALRATLFGGLLGDAAADLRRAGLYTDTRIDDDYWLLKYRLTPAEERPRNPVADPLLGWRRTGVGPAPDYRSAYESVLGERTPLLIYGDSFTQCLTPPEECWWGLLQRSPWAHGLGLVNYGVSGYGLDQTYLLLRESLPRWIERDPVVVIGIYVGDDLNRAALRFRIWPKPFFELGADRELELVPPMGTNAEEFLAQRPLAARSYLWSWLLHGSGLIPFRTVVELSGREVRLEELRDRCKRLTRAIHRLCVATETRSFFLLLPGDRELETETPRDWQERLLIAQLDRLGAPWVSARPDFQEELQRTGNPISAYFELGHYNAAGNEVAFRALDRGLRKLLEREGDAGRDGEARDGETRGGEAQD